MPGERNQRLWIAQCILPSQFFSHRRPPSGSNSLYLVDRNKLSQRKAVHQPQVIAPAFTSYFSSLSHKVIQPLHIEPSAVGHLRVIDLEVKGKSVRRPATPAEVIRCLEDHRRLVHRGKDRPPVSVYSPSVMRRTSSS